MVFGLSSAEKRLSRSDRLPQGKNRLKKVACRVGFEVRTPKTPNLLRRGRLVRKGFGYRIELTRERKIQIGQPLG